MRLKIELRRKEGESFEPEGESFEPVRAWWGSAGGERGFGEREGLVRERVDREGGKKRNETYYEMCGFMVGSGYAYVVCGKWDNNLICILSILLKTNKLQ